MTPIPEWSTHEWVFLLVLSSENCKSGIHLVWHRNVFNEKPSIRAFPINYWSWYLENAGIHISHQREQSCVSTENITWISGLRAVNSNPMKKFPGLITVWKKTSCVKKISVYDSKWYSWLCWLSSISCVWEWKSCLKWHPSKDVGMLDHLQQRYSQTVL